MRVCQVLLKLFGWKGLVLWARAECERFAYANVRLTLTRLAAGRSLQDLTCAAPARIHEVEANSSSGPA